jgi:hypothetical protein
MAHKKSSPDPIQQIVTILILLIVLVIVSHLDFGALPGEYPGGHIQRQPRVAEWAATQSRRLLWQQSPVTCATCGLHSAEARVVRDYLE